MLIPSVLALLGDNPMQSELSCHVGMNGNKFCRICKTEAAIDDLSGNLGEEGNGRRNEGNDSDASNNSAPGIDSTKGKKAKKKPTLSDMISNARQFLTVRNFSAVVSELLLLTYIFKVGSMRTKKDTILHLEEVFEKAKTIGSKTKSKELKTKHGIKDNYLEYYIGKIHSYMKTIPRNELARQHKIDKFIQDEVPLEKLLSPSLRIRGECDCQISIILLDFICLSFL